MGLTKIDVSSLDLYGPKIDAPSLDKINGKFGLPDVVIHRPKIGGEIGLQGKYIYELKLVYYHLI